MVAGIIDGLLCFLIDFLFVNFISEMFSFKVDWCKTSVILVLYTSFSEFIYHISSPELPVAFKVLIMLFIPLRTFIVCLIIFKKFDWNILYFTLMHIVLSQIPDSMIVIIAPDISEFLRNILVPLVIIISLFLIWLLIKNRNRFNMFRDSYNKINWLTRMILLFSVWIFTLYLTVVLDPEERPFSVFIRRMLTFPMFIIMGILVAFIASVSVSDKKNNETAQILANQIDDQVRYYEKLIKINDDIRGFRHDFKNHLICLRSLLNSGLTSQAIEYLDDIEHISSVTTDKYKTGNIIVDSLLDDKSDKAATVSATIEFSGFVPTIGISNADICIILSNALDNAIEACERNGGGIINIKSDFRQGYFFLEISNPVPVDVKIQNTQRLTTSKRDKNIHGFGMLNIYKTAEKYNGNSKATAENGVFTLNVELQLSDEFSSI